MRAILLIAASLIASPALAIDQCVSIPDKLSDEWVTACEAYFSGGKCLAEFKSVMPDRNSRAPSMTCNLGRTRIERYKKSQGG